MRSHSSTLQKLLSEPEKVTPEELRGALNTRDKQSNTLAHLAAKKRCLWNIPHALLTDGILTKTNQEGETPLSLWLASECPSPLPQEILTPSLLKSPHGPENQSLLQLLVVSQRVNEIPKELLDDPLFDSLDNNNNTVLHNAAYHKCLDQLQEHLTEKRLTTQNLKGQSPAHFAANTKTLSDIPAHLLTFAVLSCETTLGNSVAHWAAHYGSLHQIPPRELPRILPLKNKANQTVCHFAARYGTLAQIPSEFLSENLLLHETTAGQTVLLWAAEAQTLPQIPSGILSLKTLHRLKEKSPTRCTAWLEEEIRKENRRHAIRKSVGAANHGWI
jgi:ankyrin repeat protein